MKLQICNFKHTFNFYLKEWESSSKKIEEEDDEDFKDTDVVLLKSEQKDIINKITSFNK